MSQKKHYLVPFIALTVLFFLWGFITVIVDAFIPRLKEVFELSYAQAGLVQVAWFAAYFFISLPGGYLVSRVGYKRGIVIGLMIAAFGCFLFIPAASFRMFGFFLLALFTLAGGITILQVAANPFVSVLGDEESASSRLNLSQAFNSLGTTIAPILASAYLLSDAIKSSDEIAELSEAAKETYFAAEASAVQSPFAVIGGALLVLSLIFAAFKLPKILDAGTGNSYMKALEFPNLKFGVLAIFVYVGAEVAIGSYLVNYFMDMNMVPLILENDFTRSLATFVADTFQGKDISKIDNKAIVGTFLIFYWGGAMIGRFLGSALTKVFPAARVLTVFCIGAITMLTLSMLTSGFTAMWAALAVGLFNSIMFPTIFTLAIDGIGSYKPEGSGLLCMAIVGGAVIPPLFGLIVDNAGFKPAFILPAICYFVIMTFAFFMVRHRRTAVA